PCRAGRRRRAGRRPRAFVRGDPGAAGRTGCARTAPDRGVRTAGVPRSGGSDTGRSRGSVGRPPRLRRGGRGSRDVPPGGTSGLGGGPPAAPPPPRRGAAEDGDLAP